MDTPRTLVLSSVTCLIACDASERAGAEAFSRVDSAEVVIVTNHKPAWSAESAWVVDTVPALNLGSIEGPEEETFHGIVAVDAGNAQILVAQSAELRLYDSAGVALRRLGGAGRGPGEFTRIAAALLCDNRIIASELSPPRLTEFTDSAPPRTIALPPSSAQGFLNPLAPLYTCTQRGVIGALSGERVPTPTPPVVQRHTGLVVHMDGQGGLDTLLVYPGMETYSGLVVPFGRQTLAAARDTLIYTADTGAADIRIMGVNGRLRRIVRLTLPERPVTPADIERIRRQYLGGLPAVALAEVKPRLDAVPIPSSMPHFSRLFVAPDHTIWLQEYQPFRDEPVTRWIVIDFSGRWLGDITLPTGLTVYKFGSSDIVGVWRDDDGVEFVRKYVIRR